jgi:hypothetical protein
MMIRTPVKEPILAFKNSQEASSPYVLRTANLEGLLA